MIVTRKQVCDMIAESLNTDIPLEGEKLAAVINAVNADVQVRDWLLGLPNNWSLEEGIKLMQYLSVHAPTEDLAPFVTIQAMYQYELGEKDKALYLTAYALKINPGYSLAALLTRVASNNFPPESFAQMRKELHPRVVELCYGEAGNTTIEENGEVHEHI